MNEQASELVIPMCSISWLRCRPPPVILGARSIPDGEHYEFVTSPSTLVLEERTGGEC